MGPVPSVCSAHHGGDLLTQLRGDLSSSSVSLALEQKLVSLGAVITGTWTSPVTRTLCSKSFLWLGQPRLGPGLGHSPHSGVGFFHCFS